MDVRNLIMFFPDDTPLADQAQSPFIEIPNDTPFGWEAHCRDIFDARRENGSGLMTFDLLSGDINFSEDISDPDPNKTTDNAWGLVHALAALARRRVEDGYGNQLPLAWEVRSVEPDRYADNPEATRLYGLLRVLAADPEKGEHLEDCLWREFTERNARSPAADRWRKGGALDKVMKADLAGQSSQTTDAGSAAERLLPVWRHRLWQAIGRGNVIIHHNRASAEYERLLDAVLRAEGTSIPYDTENPIILPIGDAGGTLRYGIDLFSIFADRLKPGPSKESYCLSNHGWGPDDDDGQKRWQEGGNVVAWYDAIARRVKADFQNTPVQLYNVALQALKMLPTDQRNDLLEGSPLKKALLYTFLCAHSIISRDNEDFGCNGIDNPYRLLVNEQTWRRALKTNRSLFPRMTPVPFGGALRLALKGHPVSLGEHWHWIKAGLQMWLRKSGDPELLKLAEKNTPGLFPLS